MQCETVLFTLRQILCTFSGLCLLRMINRGIVRRCFKISISFICALVFVQYEIL